MTHSRLVSPALVAATLVLAACGGATASSPRVSSRPTRLFTVSLTGAPNGAAQGRGVGIIAFHGALTVCFRFAHLHGFVDATVAQVHSGAIGHSGPVVAVRSSGPKLHHRGCRAISPALSRAFWKRPGGYYVIVDSRRYPGGAVRAQL